MLNPSVNSDIYPNTNTTSFLTAQQFNDNMQNYVVTLLARIEELNAREERNEKLLSVIDKRVTNLNSAFMNTVEAAVREDRPFNTKPKNIQFSMPNDCTYDQCRDNANDMLMQHAAKRNIHPRVMWRSYNNMFTEQTNYDWLVIAGNFRVAVAALPNLNAYYARHNFTYHFIMHQKGLSRLRYEKMYNWIVVLGKDVPIYEKSDINPTGDAIMSSSETVLERAGKDIIPDVAYEYSRRLGDRKQRRANNSSAARSRRKSSKVQKDKTPQITNLTDALKKIPDAKETSNSGS